MFVLKPVSVGRLYVKVWYLATQALDIHAKKHFPGAFPSWWQFWKKSPSVIWGQLDFWYREGDKLPIEGHEERPQITIASFVRLAGRPPEKVEAVVGLVWRGGSLQQEHVALNITTGGKHYHGLYYCGKELTAS